MVSMVIEHILKCPVCGRELLRTNAQSGEGAKFCSGCKRAVKYVCTEQGITFERI